MLCRPTVSALDGLVGSPTALHHKTKPMLAADLGNHILRHWHTALVVHLTHRYRPDISPIGVINVCVQLALPSHGAFLCLRKAIRKSENLLFFYYSRVNPKDEQTTDMSYVCHHADIEVTVTPQQQIIKNHIHR